MINLLRTTLFPTRDGDNPGQPRGYTGRHRHPADHGGADGSPITTWDAAATSRFDNAPGGPATLA